MVCLLCNINHMVDNVCGYLMCKFRYMNIENFYHKFYDCIYHQNYVLIPYDSKKLYIFRFLKTNYED